MQTCLFLHSRHAKIEEHGNLGLRVQPLHWTAWADKTTLLHGEAPSELKAGTGPCSQRAGGQGPLHLLHSLLVPWSSACLTLWTTLSSTHPCHHKVLPCMSISKPSYQNTSQRTRLSDNCRDPLANKDCPMYVSEGSKLSLGS